jgi:hypothetical protein
MKRNLLTLTLMCLCAIAMAQENSFSVSGGYAFGNIEDAEADAEASGLRINAVFEFSPGATSFSHGFAVGYIGTTADFRSASEETNYKLNSFPIYYAPKFTIGKGGLKLFVKGALGTHVTGYTRTGALVETKSTDMGFYGGLGAGVNLNLGEKLFLSAEYEWAYMSNTFYRDGFINSAMGGIGIRF